MDQIALSLALLAMTALVVLVLYFIRQVFPGGVHGVDEGIFIGPVIALQPFLFFYGFFNVVEVLVVNQQYAVEPCRKTIGVFFVTMLPYTPLQVRGYAGVKNSPANRRHHICPTTFSHRGRCLKKGVF